jgi:hypothetical protein
MKSSSFGAIYDAFDGFEQQMEDALDGIFNEDVPPSVTAVAASVTQSFQSIIGCINTRIFMDNKKRKSGLSFDNKNVIAEPTWLLDGFEHTRHNIGKQRTQYYCKNKHHKDCHERIEVEVRLKYLIYVYGVLCELSFSSRDSHSAHRTSYTRSKCRTIIHMCHGMF